MKKFKFKLGEGGIKGLLFAHVEKIVLAVVGLLVVFVVWSGTALKPIDDNLSAERLASKAQSAAQKQAEDHWDTIRDTRFPVEDAIIKRAEGSTAKVDPAAYPAIALRKPIFQSARERVDPQLYPVEQLEVSVAYGPVAEGNKESSGRFARSAEPEVNENARPIPPEVAEHFSGYRPNSPAGGGRRGGNPVVIKPYYVVAVKGLVPLRKQAAEYEAVFKESSDYLENRDVPTYGGKENAFGPNYFVVERAEVAPDGSLGEWEVKGESWHAQWYEANKFTAGMPEEIADPRYVDQRFTSPLPPMMLRDLEPLALHSQVGLASAAASETESEEEDNSGELTPSIDGPFAADAPTAPSAPRRTSSPGSEGRLYRGESGEGFTNTAESQAEYALFRFFDYRVEPGKSYAYRVKLILEDPNDPKPAIDGENSSGGGNPKPATRFLAPSVIERLARKEDPSVHWRESEYSKVSAVATIPETNEPKLLAGEPVPGKTIYLRPSGAPVEVSEPKVKVMAVAWDNSKAMDVAGAEEVARGQAVNFEKQVEAVSPKEMMLVKVDGKFKTGAVLLDMQGGPMGNHRNAPTLPGKVLLLDSNGQLIVRSELEDKPLYSRFVYPEVEEEVSPEGPILNEGEGPRTGPRGEGIDLFGGA